MRVLIVDDEEHGREAIELSIDWEKYGISEILTAEHGVEALELVRLYQPAVLFCDMSMPIMDGIEFLQVLRQENQEAQVVIVSGYDDYRYTRAAIRASGVDYLMKPFRQVDLEQALERAIDAWRMRESSMQDALEVSYRIKQADGLLDEQRLAAYLSGEVSYTDSIRSLFGRIGLRAEVGTIALVLPRNRLEIINERFGGDMELFIFAVNNIMHDVFRPYTSFYFCRLDPFQWVLLIADVRDHNRSSQDLAHYLRKLIEAWESMLGLSVFVGTADVRLAALPSSDARTLLERLPEAVNHARASLLQSNVYVCDSPSSSHAEEVLLPKLSDQYIFLESALLSGNVDYAEELLVSFVREIRSSRSLKLEELQALTMEANLLLERAGKRKGVAREYVEQLPFWISDLNEWERLLIIAWRRLVEHIAEDGDEYQMVEAIRSYIDAHYQEDISLSSLAQSFHFSPQYIAKKFRDVYGTTVMTYLAELRMEKAKVMLANTAMSMLEIADQLGYADEKYFGKVFKKFIGYTPMQYRKLAQQKESLR